LDLHVSKAIVFEGQAAISHFFGVAASLDSLVVGERDGIRTLGWNLVRCVSEAEIHG
jgi:hypothetical protein